MLIAHYFLPKAETDNVNQREMGNYPQNASFSYDEKSLLVVYKMPHYERKCLKQTS